MNIQDAIDVIESVSGFTDESTPVGEAWREVLWFIYRLPSPAQTEPVAPTDNEIDEQTATLIPWLLEGAIQAADSDQPYAAGKLTLAAQLLGELRPTIEPVPTSERLPGDDECRPNPRTGASHWCWGFIQHDSYGFAGRWRMMKREWVTDEAGFWAPHWALPMPTPDNNTREEN